MTMIYDCFTFFNELELLTLRLHEHAKFVDRFVLVEASKTFTGKDKPLFYLENQDRFAEFNDKIIHVVCDFPAVIRNRSSKKDNVWAREYYQRDQIMLGLHAVKKDDLVIVSDVDEIISSEKFQPALSRRSKGDLTIFEMPIFKFYLNSQVRDKRWLLGPRMTEFSRFNSPQTLRMTKAWASNRYRNSLLGKLHTRFWNLIRCNNGSRVVIIDDAGWHFTSIGDWQNWRTKVDSFSHQEYKQQDAYLSEEAFLREMRETTEIVDMQKMPAFVQENPDKFLLAAAEIA